MQSWFTISVYLYFISIYYLIGLLVDDKLIKKDTFFKASHKQQYRKLKNAEKSWSTRLFSVTNIIAGDERIELPPKVLETPIIPFDQSPIFNCVFITVAIIHIKHTIVKRWECFFIQNINTTIFLTGEKTAVNGDGGIWTLAPVARPTAFRVRTLQPLGYISGCFQSFPAAFVKTFIII